MYMAFKNVASSHGSSRLRIRWLQRLLLDATKNFTSAIAVMLPDSSGYENIKGLIGFLESPDTHVMVSKEGLFSEAAKAQLHSHSDQVGVLMGQFPKEKQLLPLYIALEQGQLALLKIFNKPLFIEEIDDLAPIPEIDGEVFELSPKSMAELPRILIVDDSLVITKSFKHMFKNSFNIDIANDLKTGLELFRASVATMNSYAGVVLDNHIGSYSGVELALAIRMEGDVPILMLSGSAANDDDQNVLGFLQVSVAGKPLPRTDFETLLLNTIKLNIDRETRAGLKTLISCVSPPIDPFIPRDHCVDERSL